MAIGMTPEQYWDGDNFLPKYFRKAEKIRNDRLNEQLWLQGMYVYDAILDASPILRAFAKKGTKPHPYPSKPYDISRGENKERTERRGEDPGVAYMDMLMASVNKKFEQ